MRRMRLILLVVIVSCLMLNTAAMTDAGTELPSSSDELITTDKSLYCAGEPVNIEITGPTSGSSTDYGIGYIIKDENGDWVRIYYITTTDIHWSTDPQYYTWDQTYYVTEEHDPLGNPNTHYPNNGEQVSLGNYFIYSAISNAGPAEIEIVDCPSGNDDPPVTTTDKYTYCIGEPVNITVDGHITVTSGTWLSRGYIVKDEDDNWARDPPILATEDYYEFDGPIYFTWDQTYDVMFEYDIYGNYQVHYPKNGQQVSPGKYYIHSFAPGFVEIEIVQCSELTIEKLKISGPDEVFIHTYNEWELKITVANLGDSCTLNDVTVYDVLPAELELLDYSLTQGTLDVTKPGKGKMGSTHLTWFVGHLGSPNAFCGPYQAELILKIATTQNPAEKQEFTSPGVYSLNDGATAKGTIAGTEIEVTAGPTEPINVTALDPEMCICRKNFVYRASDYRPEDAHLGTHYDCVWGFANVYLNAEGETVMIESVVDEQSMLLFEQLASGELKPHLTNIPEQVQVRVDQPGREKMEDNNGMGAMQFIFLAQFSAFGLVGFCHWKRRKR
jgi:uncharacterized repeat protein (TIGR01451 family)